MRNRTPVAVLGLLLLAGCPSQPSDPWIPGGPGNQDPPGGPPPSEFPDATVEAHIRALDESAVRERVQALAGPRSSASDRIAAAGFVRDSFQALGLEARVLQFSAGGSTGYNVEAILPGQAGGRHLWVSAHLDTVSGSPGANDNTSGLALLLLTAEAFQGASPRDTIHFMAFDLEEAGRLGSQAYIKTIGQDVKPLGNLNADMIGYDTGRGEARVSSCGTGAEIEAAVLRANELLGSPIRLRRSCISRSDHRSFWDAGFQAAMLTDDTAYDAYPWYHSSGDTTDKLDLGYLASMIRVAATATGLLTLPWAWAPRP